MGDLKISTQEFKLFQKLIFEEFGISLSDKKTTLVQSRLRKWVHRLNLTNYTELYEYFKNNKTELFLLADAITTNVTSFFRESGQWEFLKEHFAKNIKDKKLRIWSAGCSSGQEPYTIAIFLKENLKDFNSWDIKILATDLSEDILRKAIKGQYLQKDVEGLPKNYLIKYFNKVKIENGYIYIVKDEIKEMILFKTYNLVTGNYNIFKNKFNIIFCRNVMIYFNKQTQFQVINNFIKLLPLDGLLLLGHSESITKTIDTVEIASSSVYKRIK